MREGGREEGGVWPLSNWKKGVGRRRGGRLFFPLSVFLSFFLSFVLPVFLSFFLSVCLSVCLALSFFLPSLSPTSSSSSSSTFFFLSKEGAVLASLPLLLSLFLLPIFCSIQSDVRTSARRARGAPGGSGGRKQGAAGAGKGGGREIEARASDRFRPVFSLMPSH